MKGIRKVFLGLVLMTLFGVAFNVSVKAAVGPRVQISITNPASGGKWGSGSKLSWTIMPILTDTDKSFPEPGDEPFEYTFAPDGTGENDVTVKFGTTESGGSCQYYVYLGSTKYDITSNLTQIPLIADMDASVVKSRLKEDENKNISCTFKVEEKQDKRKGGAPNPEFIGEPITITAYKVEAKSKIETEECTPDKVYLLPGEEATIKAPDVIVNRTSEKKDYPVYRFTDWTYEGDGIELNEKTKNSVKVKMLERSPGQGTVTVGYGSVNLWFEPEISTAMYIKPGGNKTVKIKESSEGCDPYTGNNVASVTINGNILTQGDQWAWANGENGTFQFSVPSNTDTSKEVELLIEMTDGNKFRRYFSAGDEPVSGYSVTVTPRPATGGTAKANPTSGDTGTEVQLTATPNDGYIFTSWDVIEGGVEVADPNKQTTSFVIGSANVVIAAKFTNGSGDEYTVTLTADPSDGGKVLVKNATSGESGKQGSTSTVTGIEGDSIIIKAVQGNSEFEKWEVKSGGVTLDDPTDLEQDFELGSGNVKITAVFSGDDPDPVELDTVRVTLNKTVKLSRFTDGDPTVKVSLPSGKGYLTGTQTGTKASGVTLKGLKTTPDEGDIGLIVNGEEENVIVYDVPKIEKSSNDVVVKMPQGACHDNSGTYINLEDVDSTKIVFKGDDDEESKTYELDSSNKKSFNWLDLSKRLKDDYDYDCDSVTMRAYPVEDGKEDKEDYAEIKLYKIKLDESGGAKYTINDEDVSDYFYAAEILEYRIKSRAKDGGTYQRWDNSNNDNFSSADGGTFTGKTTKTFKAVYSGSTSSSSSYYYGTSSSMTSRTTAAGGTGGSGSGTSGGDYDDVPKTGESKTDIWILWSVLLASILGAGFMIYKRFGLVRAIAEADRQEAEAVQQEMRRKQEKDKENMIDTIKGLRKL